VSDPDRTNIIPEFGTIERMREKNFLLFFEIDKCSNLLDKYLKTIFLHPWPGK